MYWSCHTEYSSEQVYDDLELAKLQSVTNASIQGDICFLNAFSLVQMGAKDVTRLCKYDAVHIHQVKDGARETTQIRHVLQNVRAEQQVDLLLSCGTPEQTPYSASRPLRGKHLLLNQVNSGW